MKESVHLYLRIATLCGLLAATGCGRVGFDPLSTASALDDGGTGLDDSGTGLDGASVDGGGGGSALSIQLASGWMHTCASINGTVACWGLGSSGQLGQGVQESSATPLIVDLPGPATDLDVGRDHSCAVAGGDAYCWGSGADGRLGNGSTNDSLVPARVMGLPPGEVAAIGTARFSSCALADGSVYCWGRNSEGQLGIDTGQAPRLVAVAVAGLGNEFEQLARAADRACAVDSGTAFCWGHDHGGDLGTAGNGGPTAEPVITGGEISQLGIGLRHSCRAHEGDVVCWGLGGRGELGDGLATDSASAVPVTGLSTGVTALSVGGGIVESDEIDTSCAILAGAIRCWGRNDYGQIGDGTTLTANEPAAVVGLGGDATGVSVGGGHVCAVVEPDTIQCWGRGLEGQLGHDQFEDSLAPTTVPSWAP